MSEHDTRVHDDPDRHRYLLAVDGKDAGRVDYDLDGERIVLTHTEVDDAYEGQGMGGRLAAGVLDDVRRRGLRVVPECPFIARWIRKHPDYRDLVDPDRRGALDDED